MAVVDALDPNIRVASLTPPPPAPAEPPPAPAEPPVAPASAAEEALAPSARLPGISPQTTQAIEDFAARARRQADRAEQGQAAMAPLIDAQIKRLGQPLPTPPGPVQQPQVPKREEVMSGVEQALMGLATFGAIIGGRGRTHATNAMAAMTGAIEGLSEGSKEKFDQNVKIYEMESKRAQEIYQEQRNQFLDTIQNRTLGENEMKMQLALMSQRYNDPAMQQSLANLKDTATLFEGRDRLLNELKEYDLGLRGTLYRMSAANMDPFELDVLAARYLLQDPKWNVGLPAYGGGREAVIRRAMQSQSGASPLSAEAQQQAEDLMRRGVTYQTSLAADRQLAQRVNMQELAQRDLLALIPQAVEASAAVNRPTGFVPVDQAILAWRNNTNDLPLQRFGMTNFMIDEILARAVKPNGVLDVALQQKIASDLHTAKSDAAYRTALGAAVDAMASELETGRAQLRHEPYTVPTVPGAYRPPPVTGGAGGTATGPAAVQAAHPDWDFSPSRKQFRDPAGKLYDENGKPL